MSRKNRKFSLPYNGINPLAYITEVEKRIKYIDHVFCELPNSELLSHIRFMHKGSLDNDISSQGSYIKRASYINNCLDFLQMSKGKFRRICPINAMYYKFDTFDDLFLFCYDLSKLVSEFSIDGLIISDYSVASLFSKLRPDVEIHTSCNGYQWNIRQMEIWRKQCGVTVFNPPREILRKPTVLKEMHDAGFKLKCIVNEGCLMGCPNTFRHQLGISLNCYTGPISCCQMGIGDIFKANWILPRWLKYYDNYVDIYKIAGRNTTGLYPFRCLDYYLNEENNVPLNDIFISGTSLILSKLPKEIISKITLDKVPDKLMTCECKECNKCNLCEKILEKYIPKSYHNQFLYNPIIEKV